MDKDQLWLQARSAWLKSEWDHLEELLKSGFEWSYANSKTSELLIHHMLDWQGKQELIYEALERYDLPLNDLCGLWGESALHVAVRRRRCELLPSLAKAGADLNQKSAGGLSAYQHAARRPFEDVMFILGELGADTALRPQDRLAQALLEQNLEAADEIAGKLPANWEEKQSPEERRILADLATQGITVSLRYLLKRGWSSEARGLDYGTALQGAAWFGQLESVRLLIKNGADLNARGDQHNCSPLAWAAHGARYSGGSAEAENSYISIVQELIDAGATVISGTEDYDHAQFSETIESVQEILKEHGWGGE